MIDAAPFASNVVTSPKAHEALLQMQDKALLETSGIQRRSNADLTSLSNCLMKRLQRRQGGLSTHLVTIAVIAGN